MQVFKKEGIAGQQWFMPVILAAWEEQGSKPAQGNSSRDPISKIPNTKGLLEWLK
jgi:hypothetical protein